MSQQKNVLGTQLKACSTDPMTGYMRDGHCTACGGDHGMHTVCTVMTEEFLDFSKARGNDLSTPVPEFHFPGLVAGDSWCLCCLRWVEAYQAGMAPMVNLEATHISVLEFVDLDTLKEFAADPNV